MNWSEVTKLLLLMAVACIPAVGNAQVECLPRVTITGFANKPITVLGVFATQLPLTPPDSGSGAANSANPNAHTDCLANKLAAAQYDPDHSPTSNPSGSGTAPMRNQNPINIPNSSSLGRSYGGVSTASGFLAFPNLGMGMNAATASAMNAAAAGKTITALINDWAPTSDNNPYAMNNTLSDLGMSQATANTTLLSSLTSAQLIQFIAAFAWQEGYKPVGC